MSYPEAEYHWRLVSGQQLRHQVWGEEAVLFNELSGDTHLVDAMVIVLLRALHVGPASIPQLRARFDDDANVADETGLAALLDELCHLTFVERCPC